MQDKFAIIYVRFSSAEQAHGDSEVRQLAAAENCARLRGLKVCKSRIYIDRGVSAFRGKNSTTGALAQVVLDLQSGKLEAKSTLLIENLDRLSREGVWETMEIVSVLRNLEVKVVTTTDNGERSTDDISSVIYTVVEADRSHRESKVKSQRILAARKSEREKARNGAGMVAGQTPAWLEKTNAASAPFFRAVPERAEIVRRIFQEYIQGRGAYTIAAGLTRDGILPWGGAKGVIKKKVRWNPSYVRKILQSRSVIGNFQPHINSDDGGRLVSGEPIPNYYPCVVDQVLFAQAQARHNQILRGRTLPRGRRGEGLTSLFSALLVCGRSGQPVKLSRKGPGHRVGLYSCTSGKYFGWDYDDFETTVLGSILTTDAAEIWPNFNGEKTAERLKREVEELTLQIDDLGRNMAALTENLTQVSGRAAQALIAKLQELGDAQEAAEAKKNTKEGELSDLHEQNFGAKDRIEAVQNLFGDRRNPAIRDNLRCHTRGLIQRIDIFFKPVPSNWERDLLVQAQRIRKLLALAEKRRGSLVGYRFRHDDAGKREVLRAAADITSPKVDQYAIITLHTGAQISTKGKAAGLRLEDGSFTMTEGNADMAAGTTDFSFLSKDIPQ